MANWDIAVKERLRADNLYKSYGDFSSLLGVSLAVCEGECVGIFGRTGAGKSVLLRLLACVERTDSGTISSDCPLVGFSQQTPVLEPELTAFEYLWLYAALYEIPRPRRRSDIREVLSVTELDLHRNRRVKTFSGGESKLLDLARTLMCPSDLLLLDEPMTGLDWSSRIRVWEYILHLRANHKKSVVVATSRAEDADLCDRLVLLNRGSVCGTGTPEMLRMGVGPEALVITQIRGNAVSRPPGLGLIEKEDDGIFSVEIEPEAGPVELLRQIRGHEAAIRIQPRGLDSILDELSSDDNEREQQAHKRNLEN